MHTTTSRLRLTGWPSPRRLPAVCGAAALILVLWGCGASDTLVANAPLTGTPTTVPASTLATHEVAQTAGLLSRGPVVATCPPGELALSGGWSVPSSSARVFAAKMVGNSWQVSYQTLPPTNSTGAPVATATAGQPAGTPPTAYVECLRGASGISVTQRATTVSFPPSVSSSTVDEAGGFIGNCQTGEGLVGFGFDLGEANAYRLEVEAAVPSDVLHLISWSFKVWNYDTVAHDVTFFLQCATTTTLQGAVTFQAQQATALYAGMSGSAVASCPAGTMLAGGGFQYALVGPRAGFIGNEYGQHATASGWESDLYAFASYGLVAIAPEAIAVCLSLT